MLPVTPWFAMTLPVNVEFPVTPNAPLKVASTAVTFPDTALLPVTVIPAEAVCNRIVAPCLNVQVPPFWNCAMATLFVLSQKFT